MSKRNRTVHQMNLGSNPPLPLLPWANGLGTQSLLFPMHSRVPVALWERARSQLGGAQLGAGTELARSACSFSLAWPTRGLSSSPHRARQCSEVVWGASGRTN